MPSLLLAVAITVAATAHAAPRLGSAVVHPDTTACVMVRGAPLRAGEPLLLMLFSPPRVVDGAVVGPAREPCAKASGDETPNYAVRLRYAIGDGDEIGIAVSCPGARVEYADGAFVMYTPGAKTPLRFAQCASHEGLHLTAWRDHRRTWHEYWYLGMDLEPNCTDDEVGAVGGD